MSLKPYLNTYVPPTQQGPLPKDHALNTPPSKYDHNFNGKHVTDLRSNQVYLQPLTPSLHAQRLTELYMAYPEVNMFMNHQPEDLQELLYFLEVSLRASPTRVTWAIYSLTAEEQAEHIELPLDRLAGFVGLTDFDPDHLVAALGPMVVFKPFQRTACATHSAWLVQSFAFDVLGCYRLHAWARVENLAPQGLGKKLGYTRESIYRGHWNYVTWSHVVASEEWMKENPGQDFRIREKVADWVDASLRWDVYRDIYLKKAVYGHLQLTSSKVYRNSYTPSETKPVRASELRDEISLGEYDINFAGPILELGCKKVRLLPFVPALHGRRLDDIVSTYDGPIEDHLTSQSERFDSYEGTLRYFETIRRNPKTTAWTIFDSSGISEHEEATIDRAIGFAIIKDLSIRHFCAAIDPIIIQESHQGQGLDKIVSSLLLRYAMTARPDGLGSFRVEWKIPINDPARIELAKTVGFVEEGDTYFVHAPGWKHDSERSLSLLQYPSLDRSKEFDPRQTLPVHHRWVGTVVWKDWIEGGVKDRVEKVLETVVESGPTDSKRSDV